MNPIDYVLLSVIGLVLVLALRKALRSRGSCSCGGNCSNCGGNCSNCGGNCGADCPHRKTDGNK